MDGVFQRSTGCRGSFGINIARGAIPKLNFNFMGIYAAPSDAAALTPDFSGFQDPLGPNSTNTPTITLFGAVGAGTGVVMLRQPDTTQGELAYLETVNPLVRAHSEVER